MVDAWWTDVQTHGVDRVRMLASRRDEVGMLNQLARVHLTQDGQLTGPVLVNRWGTEFQAGDRVVVRDNWYAHSDLRNGQTGTITHIHPDTDSLTFRRDVDGAEVELPRSYVDASVEHAYAQPSTPPKARPSTPPTYTSIPEWQPNTATPAYPEPETKPTCGSTPAGASTAAASNPTASPPSSHTSSLWSDSSPRASSNHRRVAKAWPWRTRPIDNSIKGSETSKV